MNLELFPDKDNVGKVENSDEDAQQSFHACKFNYHLGMVNVIIIVPNLPLLQDKILLLDHKPPVVFLQKVNLRNQTDQRHSEAVPFEKLRRYDVLNEVRKDNEGCFLCGEA